MNVAAHEDAHEDLRMRTTMREDTISIFHTSIVFT